MIYKTKNGMVNLRCAPLLMVRKRGDEGWELRAYFDTGLNAQLMTGDEDDCRKELQRIIESLDAMWRAFDEQIVTSTQLTRAQLERRTTASTLTNSHTIPPTEDSDG